MASRVVQNHLPCPKCPSSDAYKLYDDGHGHCFSCGTTTQGDLAIEKAPPADDYEKVHKFRPLPEVYHDWPERKLTAPALKKYGVTVVQDPNSKVQAVYPRFDEDGHHIGNKIRYRGKKDFSFEGDVKRMKMFGRHLFPPGGKYITVTEGQDDAVAAFQMFGSRYPSISVDSASEAAKQVLDDFEYLNSFENIIFNFDKDEAKVKPDGTVHYPGQEAALACAAMFPIGKVKILHLADGKDANEYLLQGAKFVDQYVKEWWAAPGFTPTGIKLGKDMWGEISAPKNFETVSYPFTSMDRMLYGMRLSEVVLLTADTGVGKTSIVKEIEHHILKEVPDKGVGFLHLEEPNADTALGLMSITANKPLHLPDVRAEVDNDELRGYYDSTVNNDRVVIWDHFGSNSVHEVLAKIRHMHNLGCKYIVLDHLSIVVSDQSGDERKQLDEISTKLKMICMELNIAVLAVIHQNRAGAIRGSAGPEQVANIVIKLHRDKTDPDEWRRNVTKMVCEKNRFSGKTGPMTYVWYNEITGRLQELSPEEIKKFEAGGVGVGPVPKEEQWA